MHEVGVILLYLKNYIFADDTAYPMLIPRVLVYLSPFAVTQSWWFSIVRYKIQSSANKRVLHVDETDAGKSLMNTSKSSGPRTGSCGTPLTTGI
jgi:hypothetical protein